MGVNNMVEVMCPSCHGKSFGYMKMWPDWIFACSICNGDGKINIGLKSYIRYIFTNKVSISEVIKSMDYSAR